MPRYRTQTGVVVNLPVEKAAQLDWLTVDAPPSPLEVPKPKRAYKRRSSSES